jgi:hypothetical protein
MHRQHHRALARRHEQLLLRCASLRVALAHQSQTLKSPLALADQLRSVVHWLGRHPLLPLVVLTVLKLRQPRRMLGRLPRLFAISQLLLRVWHWLGKRTPRPT